MKILISKLSNVAIYILRLRCFYVHCTILCTGSYLAETILISGLEYHVTCD